MNDLRTYRKILLLAFGMWLALASVLMTKAGMQKEFACKKELVERLASRWIINSSEQEK